SLTPAGLVNLLGDDRPAVRRRAISKLGKKGEAAVGALTEALKPSAGSAMAFVEARRNAVWALTRIDSASARAAVRRALKDPDQSVCLAAIHSASVWRDAGA